jgi:hypothetical protein
MSCLINDEPGYSNLDDDSNGALDVRVGLTARHYLESYLYRDMNTLTITVYHNSLTILLLPMLGLPCVSSDLEFTTQSRDHLQPRELTR